MSQRFYQSPEAGKYRNPKLGIEAWAGAGPVSIEEAAKALVYMTSSNEMTYKRDGEESVLKPT